MLEILYRIYEVMPEEKFNTDLYGILSLSKLNSIELAMDSYICESRETFKDYIRSEYSKDIKFAYSKKYNPGTIYCIIIGEHVFNGEKYFNRVICNCAYCNSQIVTFVGNYDISLNSYEIKNRLLDNDANYDKLKFCSNRCKDRFIEKERSSFSDEEKAFNEFITPHEFTLPNILGYIYKITNKKTDEFYVGKTIYVPVFRWGQHLKTDRFPLSGIKDYMFEVLEIVTSDGDLSAREDFWIHECFKQNPDKSLNIQNLQKDRRQLDKENRFKLKF